MVDLVLSPIIGSFGRECGDCTKCCEGNVIDEVRGYSLRPGAPCPFVISGVGCGDYMSRQDKHCKTFNCLWLINKNIPEEYKPNKINSIMQEMKTDDNESYWALTPAPDAPDSKVISWFVSYAVSQGYNVLWYIDDNVYWIGTNSFSDYVMKSHGGDLIG